MNPQNQTSAVMNALGYPSLALPQQVIAVPKTSTRVQRTQYDPEKLKAVMDALQAPHATKSGWESFANTLANTPEAKSFTGAYGTEVVNPWVVGLTSLARGFGSTYGDRKASEREAQEQAREDAINATQLDNEASKQIVQETNALDWMKVNDPNAKSAQDQQAQLQQRQAALSALHELDALAKSGDINALNKSTKNWALSENSSKNIGRREQALSALLPLTNTIARASGGSGINMIGEMLAYLGMPENATSAQIAGALPGLVQKLGLTEDFYQMSPVSTQPNSGNMSTVF